MLLIFILTCGIMEGTSANNKNHVYIPELLLMGCKIQKRTPVCETAETKGTSDRLPVQPGEQALGGCDEVDHGGQQIVGEAP